MQQANNFEIYGDVFDHPMPTYNQQSPLDYLQDTLKRKPRSSMESHERSLEIPICEPLYI